MILGTGLAVVLVVVDIGARTREAALTAKALADVSRSLDRVAGTEVALEVRVAALATAMATASGSDESRAVPPHPPASPAARATTAVPGAPDDERPPPAETTAANAAALAVVTEAVQTGQWTEGDREKIRDAMANSDLETRTEIVRQLSAAVNSGKVKMRVAGLPF